MQHLTPAQQQAASMAWQHAHPLYIIAISTVVSLVVITLVVLVRWLLSRGAWAYHPGGGAGFLKDEFVRWGAILVPYIFLGILFKFYVYELHPKLNTPQTWLIFAVCAIVFRQILRRLPFVKAMGRHIDAAKAQAKAAKLGTQS